MTQIDVLQTAFNPVFYTAYFWATAVVTMTLVCVASKTVDALKNDWKQMQLQKTRQYIASTPYRDLRRIAQQYELIPATQKKADLIAIIYNYHQQQQYSKNAILFCPQHGVKLLKFTQF